MFRNSIISTIKWQNRWATHLVRRSYTTPETGVQVDSRPVLSEEDKRRFDSVFPHIVTFLTSHNDIRLQPAMDHYKQVLEYNVPHGKKQRGLLTLAAYKLLTNKMTEEQLFQASLMGWCVEMLQAFFLVSDDISDNSLTRRGQPCWYRQENVGLAYAVNDISALENGIYKLLKKYFREERFYIDVVDLFHEITAHTINGQIMDIYLAKGGLDFSQATQDTYDTISHNKTACYSFYLPVAAAMHMVGINDEKILKPLKEILVQIGHYFQIQDDYLDCFGDPKTTGKIGTDIEEGKCSWLIVNALKLVNEEEANLLKMWYGKKDPKLVKLVYNKYVELQLHRLYEEYEKETYDSLIATISELPPSVPSSILRYCLQMTYRRQK